jgi:hypothetical protein
MNFDRAIRQLRHSVGIQPMGVADFILPAAGVFAIGALAGAGIALLFAPMTGERLRQQLANDYRTRFMLEHAEQPAAFAHTPHKNNVAKPVETLPRV